MIRAAPVADRRAGAPGSGARAARDRPGDRGAAAGARRDGEIRTRRARAARSAGAVGLGRYLGVSPAARSRSASAGRATVEELRRRPSRRLTRFRDRTEDRGEAGRDAHARRIASGRGVLLNQALASEPCGALDGWPRRSAPDARPERRCPVVCATERSDEVLDRFEALAQVVSIVEREDVAPSASPWRECRWRSWPPSARLRDRARPRDGLAPCTSTRSAAPGRRPTRRASSRALGIPCVPPELREAAVPRRRRPPCVELEEIRGDLHCHTTWSDGKATVLEMGEAARDLGYEYLAICDHTHGGRRRPGPRRRTTSCARPTRSPRRTRRWRRSACCAGSSATSSRTARSTCPTTSSRSSTGCTASVHAGQRAPREGDHRRASSTRCVTRRCAALSHPKGRHPQPPAGECARPRGGDRGRARGGRGAGGERPPRPTRPARRARPPRVEAGVPIVCSTDAHSVRGLGNYRAVGRDGAPRRRTARPRAQHSRSSDSCDAREPDARHEIRRGCDGQA